MSINNLVAANVLSGMLVFVFGAQAVTKLVGAKIQVQTAERLRIPWPRYRLIWVPEAAATLGLLAGFAIAPLGAAAAIGLVLLVAGALSFRFRVRDSAWRVLGDGVVLALAAMTALLRIASG
jgi:DoxX-like protein